jgi:hypothetical protein
MDEKKKPKRRTKQVAAIPEKSPLNRFWTMLAVRQRVPKFRPLVTDRIAKAAIRVHMKRILPLFSGAIFKIKHVIAGQHGPYRSDGFLLHETLAHFAKQEASCRCAADSILPHPACPAFGLAVSCCAYCGLAKYAKTTLYRCKRCKVAKYCSMDCHRRHWNSHKHFCTKLMKCHTDTTVVARGMNTGEHLLSFLRFMDLAPK